MIHYLRLLVQDCLLCGYTPFRPSLRMDRWLLGVSKMQLLLYQDSRSAVDESIWRLTFDTDVQMDRVVTMSGIARIPLSVHFSLFLAAQSYPANLFTISCGVIE
jgi:hypothetical protein